MFVKKKRPKKGFFVVCESFKKYVEVLQFTNSGKGWWMVELKPDPFGPRLVRWFPRPDFQSALAQIIQELLGFLEAQKVKRWYALFKVDEV